MMALGGISCNGCLCTVYAWAQPYVSHIVSAARSLTCRDSGVPELTYCQDTISVVQSVTRKFC